MEVPKIVAKKRRMESSPRFTAWTVKICLADSLQPSHQHHPRDTHLHATSHLFVDNPPVELKNQIWGYDRAG